MPSQGVFYLIRNANPAINEEISKPLTGSTNNSVPLIIANTKRDYTGVVVISPKSSARTSPTLTMFSKKG